MVRLLVLMILCLAIVNADVKSTVHSTGWMIQSVYDDYSCESVESLHLTRVRSDRNQSTECLEAPFGSILGVCDFTELPSQYYSVAFSDSECNVFDDIDSVDSGECFVGNDVSFSLSCQNLWPKEVPECHVHDLDLVAGFAYFSGHACESATLFKAELSSVESCPDSYPPHDREVNQCYEANNGSKSWVCGNVEDVLDLVGFAVKYED